MIRKIYYVEDDVNVAKMFKLSIETLNKTCPITVETFGQYESFKETLDSQPLPNLILLDLMLPTKDGFDILVEVKSDPRYRAIPIIIVSAKLTQYERYLCHEGGALTFFTKPFVGLSELNSALKNYMNIPYEDSIIMCCDISLESSTSMVTRAGKIIELSQKEFDLMRFFAKNNHIVKSKQEIYKEVWGEDFTGSRSLDMYINSLRKKVFYDTPESLKTIVRFGYKLEYNPKK